MTDAPPYRSLATQAQLITLWIAGAFISLACFGFLPRLTRNIEGLDLSGLWSEGALFGLFHVSVLHNIVHLLLGATALAAAGSERGCRRFLSVTGAVTLLLVLYGQVDKTPVVADLVPVGTADTWLHTVLALTMLGAAVATSRKQRTDAFAVRTNDRS